MHLSFLGLKNSILKTVKYVTKNNDFSSWKILVCNNLTNAENSTFLELLIFDLNTYFLKNVVVTWFLWENFEVGQVWKAYLKTFYFLDSRVKAMILNIFLSKFWR